MTRLLNDLRTRDDGITLVELMVAAFIATVTMAVLVSWLTVVDRADKMQEADFETMNELRFAKAELVKELRFADDVLSPTETNKITVWIDLDGSRGGGPDTQGEVVTFEITGSQLVRYEYTDNDTEELPLNRVVIYDKLETGSTLIPDADQTSVSITLIADVPGDQGLRTIKTQVSIRNA
ncbi:MAG: prepilin-type N-terminal cleavage/methylation domain-containing protein [Acidimicrobiia bacterium]|nr:prepilin-type N-terminal cleavage/methylation domain-containing protein [Acidimicrobiia bacterium]